MGRFPLREIGEGGDAEACIHLFSRAGRAIVGSWGWNVRPWSSGHSLDIVLSIVWIGSWRAGFPKMSCTNDSYGSVILLAPSKATLIAC
jgi:hypothetical protein